MWLRAAVCRMWCATAPVVALRLRSWPNDLCKQCYDKFHARMDLGVIDVPYVPLRVLGSCVLF